MKTKRYMPVNLAGLALIAVLWQAEARAQTAKPEERRRDGKAPAGGHRTAGRGGVKRQQSRLGSRARMPQRALVYEPFIAAAAREHGVDPRVLWTIAYLETRFRADQISPKGARGLMQFMPLTAKRFNLRNSYDARQSIDAGARYVSELTKRFNGRLDLVLAGYNSGETAVDSFLNGRTVVTRSGKVINPRGIKTGGVPPYSETQQYVRRGVLVFSRVTSAAVFSTELVAVTRMLQSPAVAISMREQAAVDRELADLGSTPATVLFSTRAAVNTTLVQAANAQPTVSSFDTVFFDLHSGARYLVKSGQIVKPLERISDDSGEAFSENYTSQREVSKSVYFGSRE
ncbi:MAG: lytic transglycosylase domain-containing protein [Pyrinomonadaceae bacterium]